MADSAEHPIVDHNNTPTSQYGWPLSFATLKQPPSWLSSTAIVIGSALALALLSLSFIAVWHLATDLLSADQERASEAVRSFLPIAAAAVGLPLIIWRLAILNRQTKTAEDKTQIDREAHYTSIFSRSIDQLGQTREINETQEHSGNFQTITRTVPNIEVRLGGIHSLGRLSEESAGDRDKIENTLRSYVRENSWSDREGTTVKVKQTPFPSPDEWRFKIFPEDNDRKQAMQSWERSTEEHLSNQITWSQTVPETRVDVNEAIDAITTVRGFLREKKPSRFYECLFVGRSFDHDILHVSTFVRCTFVNCTFNLSHLPEVEINNCRFLRSRFFGSHTNITIFSSEFVRCAFSVVENAELAFDESQIHNSNFSQINGGKILFIECVMTGGRITSSKGFNLEVLGGIFYGKKISAKFLVDTEFNSEFYNVDFKRSDFSLATKIDNEFLLSVGLEPRSE